MKQIVFVLFPCLSLSLSLPYLLRREVFGTERAILILIISQIPKGNMFKMRNIQYVVAHRCPYLISVEVSVCRVIKSSVPVSSLLCHMWDEIQTIVQHHTETVNPWYLHYGGVINFIPWRDGTDLFSIFDVDPHAVPYLYWDHFGAAIHHLSYSRYTI